MKTILQVTSASVSMCTLLLVALLLSPITLLTFADKFAIVKGQTQNSSVFDDFTGSAIDTSKWVVQKNVNGGSGGNVTVADSYVSLTSDGTSFPLIYTTANPFPKSGDFAVEFDIQYTRVTGIGTGFWVTQGSFEPSESELDANIMQVGHISTRLAQTFWHSFLVNKFTKKQFSLIPSKQNRAATHTRLGCSSLKTPTLYTSMGK